MSAQNEQSSDLEKVNFDRNSKKNQRRFDVFYEQNILFPNDFRRNSTSDELHAKFDAKENNELKTLNIKVAIAGRMMSRRIMGGASFITLQDLGGCIQLYLSQKDFSEDFYLKHFKKWNLGDILGAKGRLFKTKTGELSIRCIELRLLTKAFRPLPDKFHGLQDQELRYRQRYLDLICNKKSRNTFIIRSRILDRIRRFMDKNNFIEVETPMMQIAPGGALARPFTTHHNALNLDMYLRIAPELYLKRLVIGGFERVFEINRSFRNEGISVYHNPEFTMMELYMAYADYKDLIKLIESLFKTLAKDIFGNTKITYGNKIFDFGKPFKKLTMIEAIKKYCSKIICTDVLKTSISSARVLAQEFGIKVNKNWRTGHIVSEIFEKVVKMHLIQPTFITEYPIDVSPLARRNDKDPEIADRFELFINGHEIANGFSELNDAKDQAKRFQDQIKMKINEGMENNNRNDEDKIFDKDYIVALEYGLPPSAGLGVGIDRMVMLFTNNHSIRDVILFPTMRPVYQEDLR